jgi:hypothetical protein
MPNPDAADAFNYEGPHVPASLTKDGSGRVLRDAHSHLHDDSPILSSMTALQRLSLSIPLVYPEAPKFEGKPGGPLKKSAISGIFTNEAESNLGLSANQLRAEGVRRRGQFCLSRWRP